MTTYETPTNMTFSGLKTFFDGNHPYVQFPTPTGSGEIEINIPSMIAEFGGFAALNLNRCRIVDFNGWKFRITGQYVGSTPSSPPFLLYLAKPTNSNFKDVFLPKENIDSGDFKDIEGLNTGTKLLIINDEDPWTTRQGSSFQREDILLVRNGRAVNSVIAPYDTCTSYPKCKYIADEDLTYEIKNLIVERSSTCNIIYSLLMMNYMNNVTIDNVEVQTPSNPFISNVGDQIFRIMRCTNITINNVSIDRTYSDENHAGYGFLINNVWNLRLNGIVSTSPIWGYSVIII